MYRLLLVLSLLCVPLISSPPEAQALATSLVGTSISATETSIAGSYGTFDIIETIPGPVIGFIDAGSGTMDPGVDQLYLTNAMFTIKDPGAFANGISLTFDHSFAAFGNDTLDTPERTLRLFGIGYLVDGAGSGTAKFDLTQGSTLLNGTTSLAVPLDGTETTSDIASFLAANLGATPVTNSMSVALTMTITGATAGDRFVLSYLASEADFDAQMQMGIQSIRDKTSPLETVRTAALTRSALAPVPEPSTLTLLAPAAAWLMRRRMLQKA